MAQDEAQDNARDARDTAGDTASDAVEGTPGSKLYPLPASAARSANMKANRRTDTKPELALRSALHAMGYRYRKDYRLDLPARRVRPDIAFIARKVAVFVDGCFWHACPEHGSKPKNNEWYWSPKLRKNVERDRAADAALAAAGWTVIRLWEHVPVADAVAAVIAAVGDPRPRGQTAATGTGAGLPSPVAGDRPFAAVPAPHAVIVHGLSPEICRLTNATTSASSDSVTLCPSPS